MSSIRKEVGDGKNTKFWLEAWSILKQPLCDVFPRLFALEEDKESFIADRLHLGQNGLETRWMWRAAPPGRSLEEMPFLMKVVEECNLKIRKSDRWVWSLDPDGDFSVKGVYNILINSKNCSLLDSEIHSWIKWIPLKVNICIWRARQDKLPTLVNLRNKGVPVEHLNCCICGAGEETVSHVLFECHKVLILWKKVFAWWNITAPNIWNWGLLARIKTLSSFKADEASALAGVCYVLMWATWRWRNQIVFSSIEEKKKKVHEDLFPMIQNLSFGWIRHRSNKSGGDWASWLLNPRLALSAQIDPG